MTANVLRVHGNDGDSEVVMGGNLSDATGHIASEKAVIITDVNVARYYRDRFPAWPVIEIGTGEKIKSLKTVSEIYEWFLDQGMDRTGFVLGIGGGIVCDIAGFAASTYMRGVRFGFVPSSLLAQVDASVGGKNGVNLEGYKNIVGVFNQPEFVICDTTLLHTLPGREIACGFAEVIKCALIGNAGLFQFMEDRYQEALGLEKPVMEKILHAALSCKVEVVNRDEKEEGLRKILNFGHTFGHAIEKNLALSHGEAVGMGMVLAARVSENRGYLSAIEVERIIDLLSKMHLPTRCTLGTKEMVEAVQKDKKRRGDRVDLVLLKGIGRAVLETVSLRELEQEIRALEDQTLKGPV